MRERILFSAAITAFLIILGFAGASDIALDAEMREIQAPVVPTTTSPPSGSAQARIAIAAALRRQEATSTTTTTTTPPPTTTSTLVPPSALCGEWWVTAIAAGWEESELPTLDRVLYNESRCTNGVKSATNDVGLAQLNVKTWRHLWEADGWTTEQVRTMPALNLAYAKQVSNAAVDIGWCMWEPWHGFSGDYC